MQQVSAQLRSPALAVNENFAAVNPAALFGVDLSKTIGLVFAYYGGRFFNGTIYDDVPDATLTLPASQAAVYIESTTLGVVSSNTVGFTGGAVPLYLATTDADRITTLLDYRVMIPALAGASTVADLSDLGDVDMVPGPSDQDVLTWDAGTSKWIPQAPAAGVADLADLGDVDVISTPPADGDTLVWDAGLSKWVPAAPSGGSTVSEDAIINGLMDFWSRGTTFAAIASGSYAADRWQFVNTSAAVVTLARSASGANIPTVADAGKMYDASMHFDVTTADATIAAGDLVAFQQVIEGKRWRNFAQRAIEVSFWVKATKTGIYCVALRNSGNDRSCVAEYTINAGSTWEYKTVSFPASPSAGSWDYTNGVGVKLAFTMAAGTTYHTTAGAWQTGNFMSTVNQVNNVDTSFGTDLRITDVQLRLANSVARERTWDEETELVRRYCVVIGGGALAPIGHGTMNSTTQAYIDIPLTTPMRASGTPTVTVAALGDLQLTCGITSAAVTVLTASVLSGSANMQNSHMMRVLVTVGGAIGAAKDAVNLEMLNFSDRGMVISNEF